MVNKIGNKVILEDLSYAFNRLSNYLTSFLGFDYRIGLDTNQQSINIFVENEVLLLPYTKNLYESLFKSIDQHIEIMLENESFIENIQNFTENFSHSMIFGEFNFSNSIMKLKSIDFVNSLKELSYLTYESEPVNIGIYVCSNDMNLNLIKENHDYEYIDINPTEIKTFINSEKPLLKLLNNKYYNLVVNNEFRVVGVLKKKINGLDLDKLQNNIQFKTEIFLYIKSIINEIVNSYNDQFEGDYVQKVADFINDRNLNNFLKDKKSKSYKETLNLTINNVLNYIREVLGKVTEEVQQGYTFDNPLESTLFIKVNNQEIDFWNNGYFPISYRKGEWKLKSFIPLAHEISACRYLSTDKRAILNAYSIYPDVSEVIQNVTNSMEFSNEEKKNLEKILKEKIEFIEKESEYIFKLINIVRDMSNNSMGGLFVLITDENYFNKNITNIIEKREHEEVYKGFIKNGSSSPHIKDLESDIIMLIASIDGATLLNKDFTIFSFSEMIKVQNVNTEFISNTYGARTLAAINSSLFGTAIKISEDGDITVFRNVIYKQNKEFKRATMKVLSI